MFKKVKELLGSIRFYVVTFGWLSDYLAKVVADGYDVVVMFEQLSFWLGSVVALGTFDSVAKKFSSKK